MIRVTVPRPVADALMDGSLRLLVVEDAGHNWSYPPPDIARAIEAGERIGIDVGCGTCEGKQALGAHFYDPNEYDGPCSHCTDGRVRVGSVLPTKVMPIYGPDTCPGPPSSGAPKHICIGPFLTDGEEPYPGMMAMHVTHLHDIASDLTDALAVYGPAESLPGKFVVEVEDARREP